MKFNLKMFPNTKVHTGDLAGNGLLDLCLYGGEAELLV